LVLGRFKLGTLIRYLPYPVVGGFLAGTGWLLVSGALGVLTGTSLTLAQLPTLLQPDLLVRWLPAFLFAVLLLIVLRRYSHVLILPTMLAAAIALFYVLLWLTGTSVAEASGQGWLLGPFPEGGLWQPLIPSDLGRVHWPVIFGQLGNILTILVISVISLLLNTGALELTARQDMDLNRELQSAGLANLVTGLGSGFPGYQALSLSALGPMMGAISRLVGLVVALVCGVVLFFGAPLLSYFPKPLLGAVLLFLGLAFLVEWVYDAWFKLSEAEYGIVLLIMVVIGVFGVLEGVALGIVLAVVLFVISYSRISVVKHTLSGASYRSNVDRSRQETRTLRSRGHWLYILELAGFIFFGTANRLLEQVRERIGQPDLPPPRFVVLDFRQVSSLDASAVLSFAKMKQLTHARDIVLVFTHLSARVQYQLAKEVFTEGDRECWRIDVDLDHGVEWCEEQLLRIAEAEERASEDESRPASVRPESIGVTGLKVYMARMDVPEGTYLIHQGDPPGSLYFVESGQVTAQRELSDGRVLRLRKMGPGTVVGEMGLYLGAVASASVVTRQPSTIYHLSAQDLGRLEREDPKIAAALHNYIAQLLSERLARANNTLQALFEES
jgi:SulP family sulfate permease